MQGRILLISPCPEETCCTDINPELQSFGHPGGLPVLLVLFPSQGLAEGGPTEDGDVCTGWSRLILGAQPWKGCSPRKPSRALGHCAHPRPSGALAVLCLRPICPLQAAAFAFQALPVLGGAQIYLLLPPRAQHREAGTCSMATPCLSPSPWPGGAAGPGRTRPVCAPAAIPVGSQSHSHVTTR